MEFVQKSRWAVFVCAFMLGSVLRWEYRNRVEAGWFYLAGIAGFVI